MKGFEGFGVTAGWGEGENSLEVLVLGVEIVAFGWVEVVVLVTVDDGTE